MRDFHLERFLDAQKDSYQRALEEMQDGSKQTHWIRYIFPQLKALGKSEMSQFYGITCLAEAKAYLRNPTLKRRLVEITEAVIKVATEKDLCAYDIFNYHVDVDKFRSSMTLFKIAHVKITGSHKPNVFSRALLYLFDARECEATRKLIEAEKKDY